MGQSSVSDDVMLRDWNGRFRVLAGVLGERGERPGCEVGRARIAVPTRRKTLKRYIVRLKSLRFVGKCSFLSV